MIKINLLITKKEKKKAVVKKELVIFLLCVVILLLLLAAHNWKLGKEREDLLAQIAQTKKEVAYYKSLAPELEKAKEFQKTLENKLKIIESLRKGKETSVRILDGISVEKPEKLQVESMNKTGEKLEIQGVAMDDETIVQFILNLRNSKLFKSIELIVSEQVEMSRLKLKKFILSCDIA